MPIFLHFHSLIIIFIVYFLHLFNAKTFVYKYATNISENSHKPTILHNLSGSVSITPIIIKEVDQQTTAKINKTLWYITLNIDTINDQFKNPQEFNCLVLFDNKGLIDQIFISNNQLKMNILQMNLFKGLISLLNIHRTFEPGIEYDSSGKCYVTYATISHSIDHDDHLIIVDKQKKFCERLHYPLDVWNENVLLSIFNLKETQQHQQQEMITRYTYDRLTHQLLKIQAYERQIHSTMMMIIDNLTVDELNIEQYHQYLMNSTGMIDLISWQSLEFTHIITTDWNNDKRIQVLIEKENYDLTLNEVIGMLLGCDYQTIHLGLIYPLTNSPSSSCSLNANLFTNIDHFNANNSENNESDEEFANLRRFIESHRDSLQNDMIGTIKSAETLLHLIGRLRCLSETNQSILMLSSATMLTPPFVEIQLLHRQYNTWRDHLIDILINCGTKTCLTVVFNRLDALTKFVYSNVDNFNENSIEIIQTKEMLFKKLWPSLAHIRRINTDQMSHLYESCEKSIKIDQNYVCLMTLVNLNSRIVNCETFDYFKQMIQQIQVLLDLSKLKNNNNSKRKHLLIGLSMAKTLNHPTLTRSLFKIILNTNISSTLRNLAIQIIGKIHFSAESTKSHHRHFDSIISNEQQLAEIRTRLIEILYKSSNDTTHNDDLIIGNEILKILLFSNLSMIHMSTILHDLAKQQRWSLIEIFQQFLQYWCKFELLTKYECDCLNGLLPKCRHYFKWPSVFIGQHLTTLIGQSILLHNEIYNLHNLLLIDYTSYFLLDSNGALQLSDLKINLISKEGESLLVNFNIQANELLKLAGISSSSSGSSSSMLSVNEKHSKSTISSSSDKETWLNINLNYLNINLLPNEIFSGEFKNLMNLLFSASNQFQPILQLNKLIIDQRIQTTLTSGWIIQIDHLASLTMNMQSAMETSVWYASGRSNVRTNIGFVNTISAHLLQSSYNHQTHQFINKGMAIQGHIDFIIDMKVKNLPDSICFAMNQGANTFIIQWYSTTTTTTTTNTTHHNNTTYSSSSDSSSSSIIPTSSQNTHHSYVYLLNYTLQPVSYFLGHDNSMKCKLMNARTVW
ncbi:unnamed protein product [Schistosoma turkestanicum]|nr:unnamed protein product [Schistosoma turkestanicum]